jgi:hypothetical protein
MQNLRARRDPMIARPQEVIEPTDRTTQLEAEVAWLADELVRLSAENRDLRRQLQPPDRHADYLTEWAS